MWVETFMLVFPALLRSLCPAFHYTLEDSTFSFEGRARAPQSWQRHWSCPQKGVSWHFLLPGEAGEAAGIGVNCLSWSQHRPHLCTSLLQLLGRDQKNWEPQATLWTFHHSQRAQDLSLLLGVEVSKDSSSLATSLPCVQRNLLCVSRRIWPLIFRLLPCNSSTQEAFEIATVPSSKLKFQSFGLPKTGGFWKTKSTDGDAYVWREGCCGVGSIMRFGTVGGPVQVIPYWKHISVQSSQLSLDTYILAFDNMNY